MAKKFEQEEKYIISESQEINIGQARNLTGKFLVAFPAFRHRNYQFYFLGQLISLIGTWLQIVALGWLVVSLTNSAFWVGTVAALSALPVLIFSIFAGVIVDRFNKKYILYFTQISSMVLAFALGFLVIFGKINLLEISLLAFALGVVNAIDIPARQSFVIEMVGKDDLASAIALNSSVFNSARVIGPGIAGMLIASIGTGGTFIANGISFLAVIVALLFINAQSTLAKTHLHPIKAINQGIHYSFTHLTIRTLLVFSGVTSIFGWSYSTLMPLVVQNTFHKDATVLGYLYSATGLGALLAAIIVSVYSRKLSPMTFITVGSAIFSLSIIVFTFTTSFVLALPVLFMAGLGLIMQFSMINTTIQHIVPDSMRGRVMSIYTLMFLGMSPIGSFQIGLIAEHLGVAFAMQLGALIVLVYGIYIFFNSKKISQTYGRYKSK